MSKVVIFESVTLDGVMQAPGRPDEDPRGAFEHGGWAAPYADPVMGEMAGEGMALTGALLFGRRTYEDFFGFWPHQTDNPFTGVLNDTKKYVASTTLGEPLPWGNSELLRGDAAGAVAGPRAQPGKDLVLIGSGQLARSLMDRDLVDTYILLIHPLAVDPPTGARQRTDALRPGRAAEDPPARGQPGDDHRRRDGDLRAGRVGRDVRPATRIATRG